MFYGQEKPNLPNLYSLAAVWLAPTVQSLSRCQSRRTLTSRIAEFDLTFSWIIRMLTQTTVIQNWTAPKFWIHLRASLRKWCRGWNFDEAWRLGNPWVVHWCLPVKPLRYGRASLYALSWWTRVFFFASWSHLSLRFCGAYFSMIF